ncbi:MAG: DUF166 family protein [Candidatus Heimdallarchaeota archaeon]
MSGEDLSNTYSILIVGRDAYYERICEYVEEKIGADCMVKCLQLPQDLPPFIEQPEKLIDLKDINNPDLMISATNHPDLALYLAELAVKTGIKLLVYGCTENLIEKKGLMRQIKDICRGKVQVFIPPTICALKLSPTDKEANIPFFRQFGFPRFKVEQNNNNIVNITYERGAICGSTEIIVEELIRQKIPLERLVEKTGLFAQIGCLAGGEGTKGGAIYKGARVHAAAMKSALEEDSESI